MEALNDPEKIAAGINLVRHDDGAQTRMADCSVIKSAGHVGADAKLPRLQHDDAHPSRLRLLLLDQSMELELRGIERERRKTSDLGSDLQVLREIRQVALNFRGVVAGRLQVIDPAHWVLRASFMAV